MYYSMNNCRHNIERVITNNIEHLNNTNTLNTYCICAKVNIIKNVLNNNKYYNNGFNNLFNFSLNSEESFER